VAARTIGPLHVEYRQDVAGDEVVEALPIAARALCRRYRRNPA
jgi:hypothetical protein